MPLIRLQLSEALSADKLDELMTSLSQVISKGIGKSEQYVMVSVEQSSMLMSGENGLTAFAEVRSIGGLSSEVNRTLSSTICELLQSKVDVPPQRIYLNFVDIKGTDWGFNGRTFG